MKHIKFLVSAIRSHKFKALVLILFVNVVILAAFIYSKPGQTLNVRIEIRESEFTAFVDGKLQSTANYSAGLGDGLVISVEDTSAIPSLPQPRGIDSVTIIDLNTNAPLFDEDFEDGHSHGFHLQESFTIEDGVLAPHKHGQLVFENIPSRAYAVSVTFRNITGGSIVTRKPEQGPGATYFFRPFRHLDSGFRQDGVPDSVQAVRKLEVSPNGTARSILAMILTTVPLFSAGVGLVLVLVSLGRVRRPYLADSLIARLGLAAGAMILLPALVLIDTEGTYDRITDRDFLLPFAAVIGSLGLLKTIARSQNFISLQRLWKMGVLLIGALAFLVNAYLNYVLSSHIPHVPDAVSYIFQAKIFAAGHLAAPSPPNEEAFEFFYPPLIASHDGRWFSVFPFGHPLALAPGELVGLTWTIPPLLGTLSIFMLASIGRKVFNARAGLLAAVFMATSPFFLMTSSNFMSHGTAVFYLLSSMWCIASWNRRPFLYPGLGGLFLGLLFNTRPLTATALVIPFGAYLLVRVLFTRDFKWSSIAAFCAGGLLMIAAYLLYNLGTTGNVLTSGYILTGQDNLGFGEGHSFGLGLQYQQTQTALLVLVLNGWPIAVGLGLVVLPFLTGMSRLWDWFLLTSAMCVTGAYILFDFHAVMYGPRLWYEALPLLMLLAGHGADLAAKGLSTLTAWLGMSMGIKREKGFGFGGILMLAFLGALVFGSIHGWLLGQHENWRVDHMPATAGELRGFNGIDDRLVGKIRNGELEKRSLVLVEPCPHWHCLGNVFWLNDPWLSGDVIFAKDVPNERNGVLANFPNRALYRASYDTASLTFIRSLGGEGN